jgi:hypothetical protein
MSAHLLPAQVLVGRPIEGLILSEIVAHLMVMLLVEGVHVLLELEIHWTLLDSTLVVLKQMLILRELGLTRLLDMGGELGNYG